MNEFDLIRRLTRALPTNPGVVVGAGEAADQIKLIHAPP